MIFTSFWGRRIRFKQKHSICVALLYVGRHTQMFSIDYLIKCRGNFEQSSMRNIIVVFSFKNVVFMAQFQFLDTVESTVKNTNWPIQSDSSCSVGQIVKLSIVRGSDSVPFIPNMNTSQDKM